MHRSYQSLLADHLGTDVGPSDEEGGKEAKRQKSEPTTPISASSRPPNEYDEVMGITQVDPREAERFEEGVEPEFQDVGEKLPRETEARSDIGTHGSGVSHGGFGRSSLQECLDRLNQAKIDAPAPCQSGVVNESSSDCHDVVAAVVAAALLPCENRCNKKSQQRCLRGMRVVVASSFFDVSRCPCCLPSVVVSLYAWFCETVLLFLSQA